MIIFFNVKITDTKMSWPYAGTTYQRADWFPISNRFDIFKYCLASHAVLAPLVDKFLFYVDLAEFGHRQAELEAYMLSIFPADKLEVHWYRINYTREWRQFCDERFDDDNQLIWYSGNDDHIFIDSSLDVVQSGINTLKNDPDPLAILSYSHWTSQMRVSLINQGILTDDKNFIKYHWDNVDSIQLMKAGRFKRYWFDTDCGDDAMYRSDPLGWKYGFKIPSTVYAPTKELVRHYDGDSHVGPALANIAAPLFVPTGFLDKNIRIRVGYPQRKDGWTNLYAATERLYNVDPNSAEHRWCVEDIPLFWKSYISESDINLDQDIHALKQARDAAFLAKTRIPMTTYGHTFNYEGHPKEWFTKHLLSNKIT